jgi:hypothetical protein
VYGGSQGYDQGMSLLARVKSRFDRQRGSLADGQPDETGELPEHRPVPPPSATMGRLQRPEETPTTQRIGDFGATAGTRSHRTPHGTPSTQRIHNPGRPGR